MKQSCSSLAGCLLLASIIGCLAAEEPHVVLITIDGFPARMLRDPKTPIPHIRSLAQHGVLAEGLHVSNPTVTWPNHTTLVTGVRAAEHSVLYNGRLVRNGPDLPVRIEPKCDKSELVAVPTLYDVFHQARLRTAGIDWPCTRNSAALDDDFPDAPEPLEHTSPRLRRELAAEGILPDATDAAFGKLTGPGRDEVWLRAACHVIRARRPNFLMFHLLNTDGIHHRYGPESSASYTALALADSYVGRVLEALDEAGIRQQTTVFVLADHGFASATNLIQPNVLFRQAALLELGATNQITKARAQLVPEGGTGMIYLTNPETREADRKTVRDLLAGREGVAEILEPEQYAALGFPLPAQHPGMADLVLVAKEGYAVSGVAQGDTYSVPVTGTVNQGYHGYLASNPSMDAAFIVSGREIKRGLSIGWVDNIDVAPTIAHLLGHTLPSARGKVLSEILDR